MKHNFERYCKEYENIENYEKAVADNFKGWLCHHRLETHTSDGERRLVDIISDELIALGMYYNRPAGELIFLTVKEHSSLHNKGKHHTEEAKKKMSEAKKGHRPSDETRKKISDNHKGMLGKHHSEETKKKQSEAMKGEKNPNYGKQFSEETRNKISEKSKDRCKGFHWYNNGEVNKFCCECPPGYIPGMLRK
jgi:hypothetical protein